MYNILFSFLFFCLSLQANSIQNAINQANAGDTITLSSGHYIGKILIDKPLTLKGTGDVILDGEGTGTVITIESSNVTLDGLTIQNSGNRLDTLDSGIYVKKSNHVTINNCTIQDTLFGIDLDQVNDSVISNNTISSKPLPISLKGDSLRLYYGNNNTIYNNMITKSRDMTLSYAHNNVLSKNHIEGSRYGLHVMQSRGNIIEENHYRLNSVGLLVMGSSNTKVRNNSIQSSRGAAGIGVVLKGVSEFYFNNNIVSFNSKGLYIDAKHNETTIKRFIQNNEISYNKEAFHFHGAVKQNQIENNIILGNIDDAVKGVRGNYSNKNIVQNNYWDHYAGFDLNDDNIGDTTFKMYQYADQLWHYNHKVKFFYAAPIMTLLNFLANVAPFVEPILILEDTRPIVELSSF